MFVPGAVVSGAPPAPGVCAIVRALGIWLRGIRNATVRIVATRSTFSSDTGIRNFQEKFISRSYRSRGRVARIQM
jgi:hypothetical protein